jgi:hypothetical protein
VTRLWLLAAIAVLEMSGGSCAFHDVPLAGAPCRAGGECPVGQSCFDGVCRGVAEHEGAEGEGEGARGEGEGEGEGFLGEGEGEGVLGGEGEGEGEGEGAVEPWPFNLVDGRDGGGPASLLTLGNSTFSPGSATNGDGDVVISGHDATGVTVSASAAFTAGDFALLIDRDSGVFDVCFVISNTSGKLALDCEEHGVAHAPRVDNNSRAVRMDQYGSLTLAGAFQPAQPYRFDTHERGGVIAFLVRDTLTFAAGGSVQANAAGFPGSFGGSGGLEIAPSAGADGGGSVVTSDPNCNSAAVQANRGQDAGSVPGGGPGGQLSICIGGAGGNGGSTGAVHTVGSGATSPDGLAGGGPLSSSTQLLPAPGGQGGDGGDGGAAGGAGGGGGGCVATDNTAAAGGGGGSNFGGGGGDGGPGGSAGGIILIYAQHVVVQSGAVGVFAIGSDGGGGNRGEDGASGGTGGSGATGGTCIAAGGGGVGGQGGNGGNGGDGGSGGGGGAVRIVAVTAPSQIPGSLQGGNGGSPGGGGSAGASGTGGTPGTGAFAGSNGAAGQPGIDSQLAGAPGATGAFSSGAP